MSKVYKDILVNTIISVLLYIYLNYSDNGVIPNIKDNFDTYLWSIVIGTVVGYVFRYINITLNKTFSWVTVFTKRFFLGFILYLLAVFVISSVLIVIYFILPFQEITFSEYLSSNTDTVLKFIILIVLFVLSYTLSDFSIFSFNQYAKGQIEASRLKRMQLNLQFEALKSQLSPHYLFNSLNTISSLLYRDITIAEEYIRKLALTYQSILDSYYKNLINLEDEINIVSAYKFLMEIRFEKAFQVDINIPDTLFKTKIPPLAIQMLVENAIKHNAISENKPLNVIIYNEDNNLVISNNYNLKPYYVKVDNSLIENPAFGKSYKIGLENIRKRYAFYTNRKIKIEKNENFVVRLPIIKTKNTIKDGKEKSGVIKPLLYHTLNQIIN